MEMFEFYNGSQWVHDIFLVNKVGAMEYIMGRSSSPPPPGYALTKLWDNLHYMTRT